MNTACAQSFCQLRQIEATLHDAGFFGDETSEERLSKGSLRDGDQRGLRGNVVNGTRQSSTRSQCILVAAQCILVES